MSKVSHVLILGSAPSALQARDWRKPDNLAIVAINNAWQVRPDWDYLIHAGDFPASDQPGRVGPKQHVHSHKSYVPSQNRYGGFVYAGGTMAFTAGYWALDALKPDVLAYFACDMVYTGVANHFYGQGTADPLRDDVTLRSLEAKSARLMALAAKQGCACVNLSTEAESRLVFPRSNLTDLGSLAPSTDIDPHTVKTALREEETLGYMIEDGRYWRHLDTFDAQALSRIDDFWLQACEPGRSERRYG